MFTLSLFEIPRDVLKKIEYYRSRFFFLQNDNHKKNTSLMVSFMPIQRTRGLRIMNLDLQNKCILSKWPFKLSNEHGFWQNLLRNKYIKDKTLSHVQKKSGDSHFWMSLMSVKETFLSLRTFRLKDGNQIRF
jgi:hypothetical protein